MFHRVLRGDVESFRPLVERYQRSVHNLLRAVAPNRSDLEDLIQETFLDAYRYLSTFDQSRSFKPWLMKIARNRERKSRRKGMWVSVSADLVERLQPAHASEPPDFSDREVDGLCETLEVLAAVRTLSRPLREVVALHFGEDLTLVRISPNTAFRVQMGPPFKVEPSAVERPLTRLQWHESEETPISSRIVAMAHAGQSRRPMAYLYAYGQYVALEELENVVLSAFPNDVEAR